MSDLEKFITARDFLLQHRDDYTTAVRDFAWPKLTHFNWAIDYFDSMAMHNTATALWIVGENGHEEKRSFQEMSQRSNQIANFFLGQGFRCGDCALMVLGNVVPLWEIMLACMKIGVILVPATPLLTSRDLQDRILRGAIRHVIIDQAECAKFDSVTGDFSRIAVGFSQPGWTPYEDADQCSDKLTQALHQSDAPLLRYFTSGTASQPKLVEHSHVSYPVGHLSTMYWIGLRPGDIHLNISSPGWAKHAWSCVFAPWNAGATVFIRSQPRFDAKDVLETLVKYRVTTLCAPPTVWRMLIQHDLASYPVSLREIVGAGEPLNPEVIAQVAAAWNITIRDGYGQTETTAQIGNTPGQLIKSGSVGRPLPGYRITLLDSNGCHAEQGEIAIDLAHRPLGLMTCYHDDVKRTAEAMADGHYRTGDIASRDSDGYLTFIGRADDVFKASDYRISPFELESILLEHPEVLEAAVVPSPDPERLAVPKAFVTLRDGVVPNAVLAQEILDYARDHLAPYKRVRRIEFKALPKTLSGKIRRVELRHGEETRDLTQRHADEYWEDDFRKTVS